MSHTVIYEPPTAFWYSKPNSLVSKTTSDIFSSGNTREKTYREKSIAMGPCTTNVVESKTISIAENSTAPVISEITNQNYLTEQGNTLKKVGTDLLYSHRYAWRNLIFMVYAHLGGLYGLYLLFTEKKATFLFGFVYGYFSLVGITAGSHRLWSHRSYKARFPLRVILMLLQTMSFQNHIYEWSRDHRVHHKFSETDGDPHNAKRGFFFSHVGWLLVKKHPFVKTKGQTVDMSDLLKDPVVVFQRKYYPIMMPILAFILPTWVEIHFWGVDFWTAWYLTLFRWVLTLNFTWSVNSFAHLWGPRPYNTDINPRESPFVINTTIGEGFHNYHHTFPYDYKAAELRSPIFNFTATFIDFFARIGWAYDMKVVPEEVIRRRVLRTGDGTHPIYHKKEDKHDHIWGWGDKDMDEQEYKSVNVVNGNTKG